MKLFELGSDELKQQATVGKQIAGQAPATNKQLATPAPDQPYYATWAQIKLARDNLQPLLPAAVIKVENKTDVKPIPHLRMQKTSPAELKAAIEKLNAVLDTADATQRRVSGKYTPYSFTINQVTYTVVLSMKNTGDADRIGINRKELSPTNLGLAGQAFTRKELITATKEALEKFVRDETLKTALNAILDNAIKGGGKAIPAELQTYINPVIGTISQDFGEILAPLMVMDNKDTATFPVGNSPLVDVMLPKGNMSVKAMTGSGTSFRTVADLMDKYEKTIETDKDKKKKFEILKQFHPDQGGLNVDKIIKAVKVANTKEYQEAVRIFGEFSNWKEFEAQMKRWPWKDGSKASYKNFLEVAMDVFTAGGWGGPVGMPADGGIHLGTSTKTDREEKVAGYPSFKANPHKAAANILTYSLGQGLVRFVTKGKSNEVYNKMMTDIVSQSNAVLGHVTIKIDGTVALVTRPFSDLEFKFQYHAPTHLPGNNLPGFIAVY